MVSCGNRGSLLAEGKLTRVDPSHPAAAAAATVNPNLIFMALLRHPRGSSHLSSCVGVGPESTCTARVTETRLGRLASRCQIAPHPAQRLGSFACFRELLRSAE